MELYIHPISTTSRPVMLFAAENGIEAEQHVIDLLSGEHKGEPFLAINPNGLVPVLVDGDFRLTESSAILKYLADKIDSPAYPKDLRERARVNEMMDWLNANFYRTFAYDLVYPQLFPQHQRPGDEAQAATLEWGREKACGWLGILDQKLIGPDRPYLCGERISLADYLGAPMVAVGQVIGCDFAPYPNVARWLANMRELRSWPAVFGAVDGFAASLKDRSFVTI